MGKIASEIVPRLISDIWLEFRQQVALDEWTEPSEAKIIGFLDALPSLRRAALAAARLRWDTGTTSEMRQGNYDAIEFLERAWIYNLQRSPQIISVKGQRISFSVNSSRKGSRGTANSLNRVALGRQEQSFT
jgi:hypothetical protein